MILRIVACYAVVSMHFGRTLPFADLAVPVFMLMAFWFSPMFKHDCTASFKPIIHRIIRIAVPYLFWGCTGCVARWVMERSVNLEILGHQLLFGLTGNSSLWFLNVLIICTTLVGVIAFLPETIRWCVVISLFAICFGLQYSGANSMMWKALPCAGEITCGRIVEMIPYALVGSSARFFLENKRVCGLVGIILFGAALIFNCLGIDLSCLGYSYGGFMRLMLASGLFFVIIGFDGLLPFKQSVAHSVSLVGGLTAGCYYMYKLVGEVLRLVIHSQDSSWFTLLVFVVCIIIVLCFKCNKYTARVVQ